MSILHRAIVILSMVAACTGGNAVSPVTTPEAPDPAVRVMVAEVPTVIELRYDKTVNYQELTLRWLTLEDSRCPIGITCVWAGQMLATVEIAESDEAPLEVELLRRAGREPVVTQAFGYALRLLGVEPHPKDGVTPARSNYVMRVEIARP